MIDITGQTINLKYVDGVLVQEEWKPINIEPFKDCYMVSNYGRVKSLERLSVSGRRVNEKILRWRENSNRDKKSWKWLTDKYDKSTLCSK